MDVTLGVVIINYFSAEQVIEQVAALFAEKEVALDIVCLDNSCCDQQFSELSQLESQGVVLIQSDRNLGFGAGVNQAVTALSDVDYVCVINPDVELVSGALLRLIEHAEMHNHEGLWGGLVVDADGKPDNRSAWREPTILRALGWALLLHRFDRSGFFSESYSIEASSNPVSVDAISGCFVLIRHDVWRAVEGFDERFFLYSEEIDLCRRVRLEGFSPTVVPEATLMHPPHKTDVRYERVQAVYKARVLYADKHFSSVRALIYRLFLSFGALVRGICVSGEQRDIWLSISANLFKGERCNAS